MKLETREVIFKCSHALITGPGPATNHAVALCADLLSIVRKPVGTGCVGNFQLDVAEIKCELCCRPC